MTSDLLQKRLARSEEKVGLLEKMIEDHTRELYLLQAELEKTNRNLAETIASILDALVVLSPDGTVTMTNPAALTILGYEAEELLGSSLQGIDSGFVRTLLEHGRLQNVESALIAKGGRQIPALLSGSVAKNEAGAVASIIISAKDISQIKTTEEALRRQTSYVETLKSVAVAANEALTIENALFAAIERVCALTGWPLAHVYMSSGASPATLVPTDIWHLDEPERFREFQERTSQTLLPSGVGLPGRVLAAGKAAWITDVTSDDNFPRARAARAVGIRAGFAFPILLGSEVAGVLEFFSSEAIQPDDRLLDLMDHIGVQLGRVLERMKAQAEKQTVNLELQYSNRALEDKIREANLLNDDLKQTQGRLLQAQKLDAIGKLASGVAHDFNNLLGGILGYSSLLRQEAGAKGKVAEYAQIIEKCAERGADLTSKLLGFARQGQYQNVNFNLNDSVKEACSLLESTIEKTVAIQMKLEKDLWPSRGDPSQVLQALMNLGLNARDAMPEGGELSFETENVAIDAPLARTNRSLEPGQYVRLSITDTGAGIPKELLDRIFEPFFTTKEVGKGTGLGLAMVYGTMQAHGGAVTLYSEVGKGTRFCLYFPISSAEDASKLVEVADKANKLASYDGVFAHRHILIVDDEAVMRGLAKEILEPTGASLHFAGDGQEALDYFRENSRKVDIVLLDVLMPRMDGIKAYQRMLEIDPNLKVVFSSGYAESGQIASLRGAGNVGFVQKPFRGETLIQELLEAKI